MDKNLNLDLIKNIEKIHTTQLGIIRIKKNLCLDEKENVVKFCVQKVLDEKSIIERKGKNWYIKNTNILITINAYSYTIITAHKIK